jgi:tetratricopeptide (TPR) repeat protein/tRNA A-37 threonylcarbamoyl transferase component Bud32
MSRAVVDRRYKIIKRLGSGATGTVYKARDLKDNTIVALKILSKKKTSSETIQRFKREFKLLAGLQHPNLCTVYDFGTLKHGRSYFTMEYVDGENIFKAAKRLPYQKMYPWIVQLCRVLEYIHSKGLIHYDVKPGNILVAKGEEHRAVSKKYHVQRSIPCVKLMDFGLAGEQRLRGGNIIRGTFPYVAPEVIKGLAVDHRADLFSLGILLYEVFTRRKLQIKDRKSFVTLLKQQENIVSELPSKIVSDIPKRLEKLIMRLVEFESDERYSRANEVIKEINKISGKKFETETEKSIEGYLLSSKFVGRNREMAILQSLYEEAKHDKGKVVLITGDAGIGKSRLLREFKILVQTKRGYCMTGYTLKDKIVTLEPFYNIFKGLMSCIKEIPLRFWTREKKLWLAVLFRVFPELTIKRLGKNLPKLVPLDLKQEKLRTYDALTELITYCVSQLGEIVILLEDLHRADDLTIEFFEYLGRNLCKRNILICGTSRKQEIDENPLFKKVIDNLKKENYFTHIDLKPLRFRSLYSFLDSTITPGSNSFKFARYLMEKTGGNPFFVEEIIRILLQKSDVSIGEEIKLSHFQKVSIPETIEEVVVKRIKGLDNNSQMVTKYAAILVKNFTYDLMRQVTGLNDTELSRSLWELKKRQVLIEEGNRYRFYHATLREAINKRMAYRERRRFYYQVGKTLEIIHKKNTEKVVDDLAYYFINAKNRKKGLRYGLQAARDSSDRYANEQAIRFYKGVLGLLDENKLKQRFEILQKLAKIEALVGYYDDAVKDYKKTLNLKIGSIDKKIKIYLSIASVYTRKGKFDKTLPVYRRSLRVLKKMKSSKLKFLFDTYINVRISRVYQIIGDYKNASKFHFDDFKISKGGLQGSEAINLQSIIYHNIGTVVSIEGEYGKGHYDKVLSYYKKAYKYYKMMKAENRTAALLNDLGLSYSLKFDFEKAFEYYQKAIHVCEKIGDQDNAAIVSCNIGNILKDKGYYFKAVDCFQKALSTSKKIGSSGVIGASLLGIGECFLKLCNYTKATEYSMQALKIYRAMNWKRAKGLSMMIIGGIYQILGDYSLSLNSYRQAIKIFGDIKHQRYIADLLVRISSVFIELGAFSRARRYVEDALEIATMIEAKNIEVECYIALCRINIVIKNYVAASNYSEKGMRIAKKIGLKRQLHQFLLLVSGIHYYEKKYLKGLKIADKSIKMAKDMGTKDFYVEALLIKTKNEIKQGILSKIEIFKILNEAKKIAEELGCPEILWQVYFLYGRFFQDDKQYFKALDYYDKCNNVFENVCSRIKNKSYQRSYLDRPDRQAVYHAKNEIARLLD